MLSPTAIDLIKQMEQMQVIDCHEHLPPEQIRLELKVDVLTLFSHYTRTDLITAGMAPADYDRLHDASVPLDKRWALFKPYLEQIRFGSYARPAFIAAKEFYRCDDINDATYRAISERMAAANTPGIYRRVLRDRCKIRCCLTQCGRTDLDGDQLIPVMRLEVFSELRSHERLAELFPLAKNRPRTIDGYIKAMRAGIEKWKAEGTVGLKTHAAPRPEASQAEAGKAFRKLAAKKKLTPADQATLESYVLDQAMDIARDLDLVVCVHAGMWGDFRQLDARHFIPWIIRHPDTRIDLYHLSMPAVRSAIVIGKNWPNVWLNLCWTHIISQQMAVSAMSEMLDLVPVNKVLGFGGDYHTPVEKVLGHLMMAREDIATVLAARIDAHRMRRDEALAIIHKWLWDNPRQLYKLAV